MSAFADAGRGRDALQHYEALKVMLQDELDLPPAAETTELSKRIRQRAKGAK
jgi:DNA-binding SARP family transcriptional activator